MPTKSPTFGQTSALQFAKKYPSLSYSTAEEIAREQGKDPSDTSAIVEMMKGRTFQEKIKSIAEGNMQERAKERRSGRVDKALTNISQKQVVPTDFTGTPQELEERGVMGRFASLEKQGQISNLLFGRQMEVAEALREADYNKAAYKQKRIAELDPVGDIDQQILSLRNKALVSRAQLAEQITDLSPSAQQRILAERMGVFTNEIGRLKRVRDLRMDAADRQVDEEISAKEEKIGNLEAQQDSYEMMVDMAKARGMSERDMAQVFVDLAKIREKAAKAKGDSGLTTRANVIYQQLLDAGGPSLTSEQRGILKGYAKEAAKKEKEALGERATVADYSPEDAHRARITGEDFNEFRATGDASVALENALDWAERFRNMNLIKELPAEDRARHIEPELPDPPD